jgi:hypothetical protein
MKKLMLLAVAALFGFGTAARADDKNPVVLKIVTKSDKYKLDLGGKTADEYKKELEDAAKKSAAGELLRPPAPPKVDFVLEIKNTGKEAVTIFVGGDPNVYTFELTGGAGTVTMGSGLAFTADFRLPKEVTLAAGKTYEIGIKQLSDGSRGASRFVYWTGPGEYKLTASYTLADKDGGKGAVLKSEPVKITVEK